MIVCGVVTLGTAVYLGDCMRDVDADRPRKVKKSKEKKIQAIWKLGIFEGCTIWTSCKYLPRDKMPEAIGPF